MFDKGSTVLVLGAGASSHYGYPLGESLVLAIIDELKRDPHNYNAQGLRDALEIYDPVNIDFFLSHHLVDRASKEAGKLLIALEILKRESKDSLRVDPCKEKQIGRHKFLVRSSSDNWYRYLWYAITSGGDAKKLVDPENLKLKIITFNYDMSFEYFIFSRATSVKTGFTIFKQTVQQTDFLKMFSERIIHIHGSVSPYQWQIGADGRYDDSYGDISELGKYEQTYWAQNYSANIRIMDQNDEEHPDVQKAKVWLQEADRVYFLGYGFDPTNNALLNLKNTCQGIDQIYYTNYGMSKKIEARIRNLFSVYKPRGQNLPTVARGIGNRLIVSEKDVYSAIASDFSLIPE